MTTHEMMLPCSSLLGVRTCIRLCWVLGFATVSAFGKLGNPFPPTAWSMPQHSKFFLITFYSNYNMESNRKADVMMP